MSDRQLQTIQDTIRLPLYQEEPHNRFNGSDTIYGQRIVNLIPEFIVDPSNQTKKLTLQKRPGIADMAFDYASGKVANETQLTVLDFIAISALYDVCVIAVHDASNSAIYIIQVRPITGTSTLMATLKAGTAAAEDFCFLTEYSQSSGGSLYPAVVIHYTKKDLTASAAYYAVSSAGVFGAITTEITDTGFPPKQTPALITVGRFQFMNGTLYIASLDGRIWNSYATTNDAGTWKNSTSQIGVISAMAYNDQLIGLERYKHHIVAFGKNTIQFFNETEETASPLSSTEQAFIKMGAKSPRLIKNINDNLYWVGYGEAGTDGVWELNGYTPVKISSASIDASLNYSISVLSTGLDLANTTLQGTMINGKLHLILNGVTTYIMGYYLDVFPTGAEGTTDTYQFTIADFSQSVQAYNIEDKTWWTMQLWMNRDNSINCAGSFNKPTAGGAYNQYIIATDHETDFLNTYIYKWRSDGLYKDSVPQVAAFDYPSLPIMTAVQTNHQWFGNEKRKRINKVKLIGYPQSIAGDTAVYSMYLVYARDSIEDYPAGAGVVGYLSPTITARGISIPTGRMYWNNCGMGRAWTFLIFEKSKLPLKLEAIEVDVQQGSH